MYVADKALRTELCFAFIEFVAVSTGFQTDSLTRNKATFVVDKTLGKIMEVCC